MQPLSGLLVVAIEQAVAAPLCSARLLAAGARVIKIEREEGDFARQYDTAAKGESSYFTWLNQGKESICLDFKTPAGSSMLERIIKAADVFIQNLTPGAMERAGFGSDRLFEINPALVVCNISGYGVDAAVSQQRAYDLLVQAESGLIAVSGSPGHPGRIGVSICDIGAGMTAYSGVLEALLQRKITGEGAELWVSLFDVAAEWMSVPFIHAQHGEGAPEPAGLQHPSIAPYGAFSTRDGKRILISVQNEREWRRFCGGVLNKPSLAQDPRFISNASRVAHRKPLDESIQKQIQRLSAAELESCLAAERIAFGMINTAVDLAEHPALKREPFMSANHQVLELPAAPIVWSKTSSKKRIKAPLLGEHTDLLLSEFGGL